MNNKYLWHPSNKWKNYITIYVICICVCMYIAVYMILPKPYILMNVIYKYTYMYSYAQQNRENKTFCLWGEFWKLNKVKCMNMYQYNYIFMCINIKTKSKCFKWHWNFHCLINKNDLLKILNLFVHIQNALQKI